MSRWVIIRTGVTGTGALPSVEFDGVSNELSSIQPETTLAVVAQAEDASLDDFWTITVVNNGGGQIVGATFQYFKSGAWVTLDSSAITSAFVGLNPNGTATYTTTKLSAAGVYPCGGARFSLQGSSGDITVNVTITSIALGQMLASEDSVDVPLVRADTGFSYDGGESRLRLYFVNTEIANFDDQYFYIDAIRGLGLTGTYIGDVKFLDGIEYVDTIAEQTATAGVTVDGVLLKDGGVSGAGAIAMTLATDASSSTTGAIKTAGGMGVAKALYVGTNVYAAKSLHITNLGTTPVVTVTIVEYADGRDVTTELTLANFIIGAQAGAAAALGLGNIVYAFPAGQHFELVSALSAIVLTCAGTAVASVDVGLGSVIASGAVATLDGTATFEDRLTGQTFATASGGGAAGSFLKAATAGIGAGISLNVAGSVKNVFLNAAATWNADNTGNLTASGKVILKWTKMS